MKKKNSILISCALGIVLILVLMIAFWLSQSPKDIPSSGASLAASPYKFFQFWDGFFKFRGQQSLPGNGYKSNGENNQNLQTLGHLKKQKQLNANAPHQKNMLGSKTNTQQNQNPGNSISNSTGYNAEINPGDNIEISPENNPDNNAGNNADNNSTNNSGNNPGNNPAGNSGTSSSAGGNNSCTLGCYAGCDPTCDSECTPGCTPNPQDSGNNQNCTPGCYVGCDPTCDSQCTPGCVPNPQGPGNNQNCTPGCYSGCDSSCDPDCTAACSSGNSNTNTNPNPTNLPPSINPIPSDSEIAQSIALENQRKQMIADLVASYQVLAVQVLESNQASKYQTVTAESIPPVDNTPAPQDVLDKIKSGQLIHH